MSQFVPIAAYGTLIAAAGECAQERFIEFFTGQHPQPQHPPRLCAGGARIPRLVRGFRCRR